MLVVKYGPIIFYDCQLSSWESELLTTEQGDPIGIHVKFSVRGVLGEINRPASPIVMDDVGFKAEGKIVYHRLTKLLKEPRKSLEVFFDEAKVQEKLSSEYRTDQGYYILRVVPGERKDATQDELRNSYIDTAQGPKISHFSVEDIGHDFVIVNATFETTFNPWCDPTDTIKTNKVYPIAYLQYSITETLDQDFYITKIYRGSFRLSFTPSDYEYKKKIISQLPGVIAIPLEPGFRRDVIEVQLDENHYKGTFLIRDVQTSDAPPWPISRWNFRHSESTTDGVSWSVEIRGTLTVPPHVHRKLALIRFAQLVANRISLNVQPNVPILIIKKFVPEEITFISNHGDKKTIECIVRLRRLVDKGLNDLTEGILTQWGEDVNLPDIRIVDGSAQYMPKQIDETQIKHDYFRHPIPNVWGYSDLKQNLRDPIWFAVLWNLHNNCGQLSLGKINIPDEDLNEDKEHQTAIQQQSVYYSSRYGQQSRMAQISPIQTLLPIMRVFFNVTPTPYAPWVENTRTVYTFVSGYTEYYQDYNLKPFMRKGSMLEDHLIVYKGSPISKIHIIAEAECAEKTPRLPGAPYVISLVRKQNSEKAPNLPSERRPIVRAFLAEGSIKALTPYPQIDGTLIYRVKAEYIYYLEENVEELAYLQLPLLPILGYEKTESAIDLNNLDKQMAIGRPPRSQVRIV